MISSELEPIVVSVLTRRNGGEVEAVEARLRLLPGELVVEPTDSAEPRFQISFGDIESADAIGPPTAGWQEVELRLSSGATRRLRWPLDFTATFTSVATGVRPLSALETNGYDEQLSSPLFAPPGGLRDQLRLLSSLYANGDLTTVEYTATRSRLASSAIPPGPPNTQITCALGVLALIPIVAILGGAWSFDGMDWILIGLSVYFVTLAIGSYVMDSGRPMAVAGAPLAAALASSNVAGFVGLRSVFEYDPYYGTSRLVWVLSAGWLLFSLARRQIRPSESFDVSIAVLGVGVLVGAMVFAGWLAGAGRIGEIAWENWVWGGSVALITVLSVVAMLSHRVRLMRLAWGVGTVAMIELLVVSAIPSTNAGDGNWPLVYTTLAVIVVGFSTGVATISTRPIRRTA